MADSAVQSRKNDGWALKSLDVSARENTLLRHENALLERLCYVDPATGLLPEGMTLGGDVEAELDRGKMMVDLSAVQVTL